MPPIDRPSAGTVRLHVEEAGPADGPVVVLLHGFPEFSYAWRKQLGPLAAAGFRVLAPDQRGYGRSDKPEGIEAYRLDELADDVLRLAGDRRFSLVGHDWGGVVAWWLALCNPDRLQRLVILNAPHPATLESYALSHPGQLLKSWYVLAFQLPGLPEALFRARDFRLPVRTLCGTSRPGTFTPDDIARYRAAWSQARSVTAMLNWYRALLRHRRPPPAERCRVPTLILWGDRDAFLEPGLADAALALCDQGRLVRLRDATHWIQHEQPDRVNAEMTGFLGAVRQARLPG